MQPKIDICRTILLVFLHIESVVVRCLSFFLQKIRRPLASTKCDVNSIYGTVYVFFFWLLESGGLCAEMDRAVLPLLLPLTFARAFSQRLCCYRLSVIGSSFRYGLQQPADAPCRRRPRCIFDFLQHCRLLWAAATPPPDIKLLSSTSEYKTSFLNMESERCEHWCLSLHISWCLYSHF